MFQGDPLRIAAQAEFIQSVYPLRSNRQKWSIGNEIPGKSRYRISALVGLLATWDDDLTDKKVPQLKMIIPEIPAWRVDWEIPAGYEIVTYSEGIENEWLSIINESFNKEFTVDDWQRIMLEREGYRPDRIFFVKETLSGEICATAAAVRGGGAEHGYLHFVGVRPQWAGRKLGYCVSCAATESFKADGCTDAALNTDAHRLAALKTYLRLGYRPQPRHEAHGAIWTKALGEIGFEHIEICSDFP